jgi:hypothetical protein
LVRTISQGAFRYNGTRSNVGFYVPYAAFTVSEIIDELSSERVHEIRWGNGGKTLKRLFRESNEFCSAVLHGIEFSGMNSVHDGDVADNIDVEIFIAFENSDIVGGYGLSGNGIDAFICETVELAKYRNGFADVQGKLG